MSRLDRLIARLATHTPRETIDTTRREAAVAVLLTANPDRLLLIRRAEHAGDPWSGHIALPGGKREIGDTDLLATAIRETEEETGVVLQRDWCRAQLDDLAPVTSALPRVIVRPYVFLLPSALAAATSDEVTHAGWTPLSMLAADGVYGTAPIVVRGSERIVPGYHLPEGFLWGMTERILTPLFDAWREAVPPV